jgi:hypothetical protein
MATHHSESLHVGKFETPQGLKTAAYGGLLLGLITIIIGIINKSDRVWTAYLVSYFFFVLLALGGMFWTAVNNLSKAGWSVSIRRVAEAMTAYIPWALVLSLPILFIGLKTLYPWARPEVVQNQPMIAAKTAYLNVGFMLVRVVIFLGGVWLFSKVIIGNSLKQDQTGDDSLTVKNVAWSVGYMPFFAIMFSLFSVDLVMSLMPTWYSTIFGIYCFSGMFQSFLALFAICLIFLKRKGFIRGYFTDEHLHDVTKFLKGFTVFWAYIAFSQFMLIWYANIPEETEYYLMRAQNGWTLVSVGLLVFRFIVPFLALLPKGAKRNENHVILVSGLILVMQYVDIYWMVYPNFFDGHFVFSGYEVGVFLGFLGVFILAVTRFMAQHSLVAIKDPRMHEALSHHVTY